MKRFVSVLALVVLAISSSAALADAPAYPEMEGLMLWNRTYEYRAGAHGGEDGTVILSVYLMNYSCYALRSMNCTVYITPKDANGVQLPTRILHCTISLLRTPHAAEGHGKHPVAQPMFPGDEDTVSSEPLSLPLGAGSKVYIYWIDADSVDGTLTHVSTKLPPAERLRRAASIGDLSSVETLMAAPLLAHQFDEIRDTPLHYAAAYDHGAVVRFLLAHGAPLEARNIRGRTPLTLAVRNGHLSIVRLLLSQGADAQVKDADGFTLAEVADGLAHGTYGGPKDAVTIANLIHKRADDPKAVIDPPAP